MQMIPFYNGFTIDNIDFGHNPDHNFFQLSEVKLNAWFNWIVHYC